MEATCFKFSSFVNLTLWHAERNKVNKFGLCVGMHVCILLKDFNID